MKKLLMILGGIFGALLLALIILAIIFIPRFLKLDREATEYIQSNVPKIVANWNPTNLMAQASSVLLTDLQTNQNTGRMFEMFSELGSLKHLNTPEGKVFSGAYTGEGTYTIGNYDVKADFDKGPATIRIQLLRVGDAWKINGFRIYSDAFLPPGKTAQAEIDSNQPPAAIP